VFIPGAANAPVAPPTAAAAAAAAAAPPTKVAELPGESFSSGSGEGDEEALPAFEPCCCSISLAVREKLIPSDNRQENVPLVKNQWNCPRLADGAPPRQFSATHWRVARKSNFDS